MQSLFLTLLDSGLVLAGHGYDFRGSPTSGGGDGGEGGIGMTTIIAVLVLALLAIALMVWLNRQEKESERDTQARAPTLRSVAPVALTVAIIAAPLIVWTAASGGDDEKDLMVERWTTPTGEPELLVTIGDDDLNSLRATSGKRTVRLECRGRQGQAVLNATQKWPFVKERGYDYPHAHQPATREQLQRADRCRVRGTHIRLEADVEGSLTG